MEILKIILIKLGNNPILLEINGISMTTLSFDYFNWWIFITNIVTLVIVIRLFLSDVKNRYHTKDYDGDLDFIYITFLRIMFASVGYAVAYLASPLIFVAFSFFIMLKLIIILIDVDKRYYLWYNIKKYFRKKEKKKTKVEKYKQYLTKTNKLN